MRAQQKFLTFCPLCLGHCSVEVTVENGRIVEWERDIEGGFPNEPCPFTKGRAIMEITSHPERLKYPLKREGAKGEGKWKRIPWDEALDTIAARLKKLKSDFGPECVALGLGEVYGMYFAFAERFASAFGTPNVATPGHLCGGPSDMAHSFTYGSPCVADNEHLSRLILIWGCNPINTSLGMRRETMRAALLEGAKLVVIDPKKIDIANRADLWIRPRPGSDGALAMGLLKVMIDERLYDENFVAQWTIGFEHLRDHTRSYSLEDVERVTWVPRQQIEELARLYACVKPAVTVAGNTLENLANAFQVCRAVSILRAISGNVNVPGGDVFFTPEGFTRPGRFMLLSKFPRKAEQTLGREYRLAMMAAFIPYQALVNAILEEKPYPIRAALFFVTNPLLTYPDANKTYRALMKLDFMVVSELFMTPTAAIADIVLPAAISPEHNKVCYWLASYGALRAYPKLIDPPGEAWPDTKIINELAKRIGLEEYFWDNDENALDAMLEPSGITFEEFKHMRMLKGKKEYKSPQEGAFRTSSGKVEIYSKALGELGYSPMPTFQEVSPTASCTEEYPLLLTNGKDEASIMSSWRHIAYMRNIKPQPVVELNPDTAQKAGLKEGDWVYIETKNGRISQKLLLNPDLDPRVVFASFGWWFPEEPSNLYGWSKSNINILTEDEPADSAIGAVLLRGIPCRVGPTSDQGGK